jgi:hypothetical protein
MSECSHFTSTHKKFGFIEALNACETAGIKTRWLLVLLACREKKPTSDTDWYEGAQRYENSAGSNDSFFIDSRDSVLRNETVS